ncbi:MAG: O-antigen ligase family protein [Myxococcota bacterium]
MTSAAVDLARSTRAGATRAGAAGGFLCVGLYTVLDYGRPQDIIPGLSAIPLGLVVTALLAILLLRDSEFVPMDERIVRPFVLLLVFAAIWVPFAHNNYWAFQTFKQLLIEFLVVLAMLTYIRKPEDMQRFLNLWLWVMAFQACYGITHSGRGNGSFMGDENDFALAMNMALPFALFGCFAARSMIRKIILFVIALLCVAGVVAAASRSGLLGMIAAAGATMLMSSRRIAFGALGLVLVGVTILLAPSGYWADMETMFDPRDSTRVERFRHWDGAERAFWDNPILGVGPGNIPWRIGEYEIVDDVVERSLAGRAVHSLYYTLLAELGLFGIFIYGWLTVILLSACRSVMRAPPDPRARLDLYARATVASGAACLVSGAFISVLYYPHLYLLLAIGVTLWRLSRSGQNAEVGGGARAPLAPLGARP